MQNDFFSDVLAVRGAIVSKLIYYDDGTLTLLLKKADANDESSFSKIIFKDVIAFHDTGFVLSKIDYFDINSLSFVYIAYLRSKELDIEDFAQAVFISKVGTRSIELIVVFKQGHVLVE